jgi:serine/threonine protein phosphatase PrpC
MPTGLRWGSATDVGRVRSINQDLALAGDNLFAVADGMGGARGGEVAAELAVNALTDVYSEPSTQALVEAIQHANEVIFTVAAGDPELRGMGTTLTAVAPVEEDGEDLLAVVNVGDSRTYRLHDGELEQLTEDHSLVEEMVREGRLSAEEAQLHPQRNIITRALGVDPDVEVDQFSVVPYVGDRFLLCSDGLFNEVDDSRIAATLRRLAEPQEAASELVRLANEGGGRDNITVVVVDVVDDDHRAEKASAALGHEKTAAHTDLAGFSTATATAALPDVDAEAAAARPSRGERRAARREAKRAARAERPRRLTWRVAFFIVLVLAVFAAAATAIWWQARNTYFVAFNGEEVAVFRGQPGGVLWFDPTFEEATELTRADVPPARVRDLENGREFGSLDDARAYVENLSEQSSGRASGATTTTTLVGTTTTVLPTTSTTRASSP